MCSSIFSCSNSVKRTCNFPFNFWCDSLTSSELAKPNSNSLIGSYDENRDCYNLTLDTITVSFSEIVGGWTSFKSFLLESGISLNGEYYTWKNGDFFEGDFVEDKKRKGRLYYKSSGKVEYGTYNRRGKWKKVR